MSDLYCPGFIFCSYFSFCFWIVVRVQNRVGIGIQDGILETLACAPPFHQC